MRVRRKEDRTIQRLERRFIGYGLKLVAAIVLLAGLIWGGQATFVRIQEHRFLKLARTSLAKGDYRWAAIGAQRAFELNPKNVEACRLFAEVSERQGSASAVEWRHQVAKLRPDSIADAVAFAQTALRFGQLATAKSSLAQYEGKGSSVAAFHQARAQIAFAEKDTATAEKEFAEAVRLNPAEKDFQLGLAVVQLQSPRETTRAAAREAVQKFLDDPSRRKSAARALRDAALQERNPRVALENAKVLAELPDADFQDRLSYLQMLRQLGHPDYPVRLLDLETDAAANAEHTSLLLRWLASNQQSVLAVNWAKQLPTSMTTQWPVVAAVAECYGASKDWTGLQDWCGKTDWAGLDFLRHAAMARALRETGVTLEAEREWNVAQKSVRSDPAKMHSLQQVVAAWGWKAESLELLWGLTKDPAQQLPALDALFQHYLAEGNTADLYRVAVHLSELRPDDAKAENNIAQLALLLGVDRARALRLAKKAYEQEPANPEFASTFAFSLYCQGQFAQAVDAFRMLKDADLHEPAIAAYYGIVLAAAGAKEKAREFLAIGKAASLLPEERELITRAETATSNG